MPETEFKNAFLYRPRIALTAALDHLANVTIN